THHRAQQIQTPQVEQVLDQLYAHRGAREHGSVHCVLQVLALAGIEGNLECTLDARHHSVSDAPSTVLPAAWVAACAAVAARHKCTPAVSGGIDNLNDASYTGHLSSNVPIFTALPWPAICNVTTKEKITMTFQ